MQQKLDIQRQSRIYYKKWINKCNNKINKEEVGDFVSSTKLQSPTPNTGGSSIPPTGHALIFREISQNNFGYRVFVSFELTDILSY